MSSAARLGLVAFSAGVSALIVALIMPYTDPEYLDALARHPLGSRALSASNEAMQTFARLLLGASSAASGPSLRDYYPLVGAKEGAPSNSAVNTNTASDLDWADPAVWQLQQKQVQAPYYTAADVDRLLHWCRHDNGSSDGGGRGGEEREEREELTMARARFARLATWVASNGGDVSGAELGTDRNGVRGLHATRKFAAGEVVLSVPLRLGLSIASFRAARMASGPTARWRRVEDADLFLDALALSYEVAVHGDRSPWADYMCLLPRSYGGLPVHISDPEDAALLLPLPSLRRLAAKRRAQLALFGTDLARQALETLPGGRAAMVELLYGNMDGAAAADDGGRAGVIVGGGGGGGGERDPWLALWHWAYAAAKTRAVTLGAEEMREGAAGAGGTPGESLPLPLRLPLAMLEWVREFGVLLPVLDMANHAFDGQGANVVYQLLGEAPGSSLVASLVALERISPGQPLLFDYVGAAEADQGPSCVDRWLLEYGFVPENPDPRRDCDVFTVTAVELAAALRRLAADPMTEPRDASRDAVQAAPQPGEAVTSLEARLEERLSRLPLEGLPRRLDVYVRQPDLVEVDGGEAEVAGVADQDHVRQRWAVLQWLGRALALEVVDGVEGRGVGRRVLRTLLEARLEALGALGERARERSRVAVGAEGAGPAEVAAEEELRRGVVSIAAAGRRAVGRALEQERSRA